MSTEFFIAKRIFADKSNTKGIATGIVRFAVGGIAVGLVVMILSISILSGFKNQITNKISGFGSHLIVSAASGNESEYSKPIHYNKAFYDDVKNNELVKSIQIFAMKPGIIKTKEFIQGVVLKGINDDFDYSFLQNNLVAGVLPKFSVNDTSNQVVLSQYIASLLRLKVGDKFVMYFIQQPPRVRKFTIAAIYKTDIEEIDKQFIIGDINQIRKINNWSKSQINGYEINLKQFENLYVAYDIINQIVITNNFSKDSDNYLVSTIEDMNPEIFQWLKLTDTNVVIILILMTLVAGFNMVSGLLILILERTHMIGLLKAIGATNGQIRKIFLTNAFFLIGKGMIWGNIIGICICLLQKYLGFITLDATVYYVKEVPINIDIFQLVMLNIGTIVATLSMLLIPSFIISKISPVSAIKME